MYRISESAAVVIIVDLFGTMIIRYYFEATARLIRCETF
jgi:hypothetical protein